MGQSAKVRSIDVLPLLSTAFQKYRGESLNALDDLETELRRLLEWIQHDRRDFWMQEGRKAQELMTQARLQLQQAQTARKVAGHEPSCIDERRAVDRARRRLETAQRKIAAVRHWTTMLERAADDFRRTRSQFASWLDVDIIKAVNCLNQMSESLVAYISMKSADRSSDSGSDSVAELAGQVEPASGTPETATDSTAQTKEGVS